jgi:hypothetical protein
MGVSEAKSIMPPDEAKEFIEIHISGQMRWYWREVGRYNKRYSFTIMVAVMSGFLATAFAAFPPTLASPLLHIAEGGELTRWLAVVCSAVSVASGILQSYYSQLAKRREIGRIQTQYIEQMAPIMLCEKPMSVEERTKYKAKIIADLAAIEMAHGAPIGMIPAPHGHFTETPIVGGALHKL